MSAIKTETDAVRLLFVVLLVNFSQYAFAQTDPPARPAIWATRVGIGELSNSFRIDSIFYRAEQPSKSDMKALETDGFKTILNLRNVRNDKRKARGTSLTLVHVPVNTWRMSYDDVVTSLKEIQAAKKPVLLHCIHGSDRTGVVTACYRMTGQGWSKEDAIDEFLNGGYGYHSGWFPNILRLLKEMDVEKLKADVAR
jgi:tyrosine-protein phosphatase SIW14